MAPIEFEEQIKDKLEQRSIQPSSDAWNKLSERLDEEGDKQNSKGYWWIGIAAAIVGVLFALTFIFKSNTEIIEPIIVDTTEEAAIETQDFQNPETLEVNNKVAIEESKIEPKETIQKETKETIIKAPLKSVVKEQQDALIPSKFDEVVAQVETKSTKEEEKIKTPEQKIEIVSFETQKVNEVVVQIQKLQKENKEVTTAEIDALLEIAQEEITMQKLYDEATKTVDAEALLQSVEDDLEQSFRDKVFNTLTSGYKTLKTAVAERNN